MVLLNSIKRLLMATLLSAIRIPTYSIAKFYIPILKDLTSNEYSLKTRLILLKRYFNKILVFLWQALT